MKLSALAWIAAGLIALSARGAEITVFAAASLADALTEIQQAYQPATGDRARFNFAASSTLAVQIRQGAPADVFFPADQMRMDELATAGLVLEDTRRTLLSNTLVIVTRVDSSLSVAGPDALAGASVRRIALAEPQTVPAGIYAREFLQKAGLWTRIAPKVVPTENVRACLAAVESGNVDAGIVYKTDALISKEVKIVHEIPLADGPKISYPVAVVKDSRNAAAARRFVEYLATPTAQAVFARHGFLEAK